MKKTTKKGHKFIVFLVLISLLLLFVTCGDDKGGGQSGPDIEPSNPPGPSKPPQPSSPSQPSTPSQPSGPSEQPLNTYTVIYDKNAGDATGTMANSIFTNKYGNTKKLQANNFTRNNYCFLGWATEPTSTNALYNDKQEITIYDYDAGKTLTLYAVWHETSTINVTNGSTLWEKYSWICDNAKSYTTYIIENNSEDKSLSSSTFFELHFETKKHITIHLKGTGSIFPYKVYIGEGVTFILDGNTINSEIKNYDFQSGNFILNNGKVNLVTFNNGTFIMNGGESISVDLTGGGGTFTMNGGEINGRYHFAVCVGDGGTFTMYGGKIHGLYNYAVLVGDGGTFTMYGGMIYDNTSIWGSGVNVMGTFNMYGGEIYGNTAGGSYSYDGLGGGVRVGDWISNTYSGTFNMYGGEIYGNTAFNTDGYSFGGGVYVGSTSNFYKTGGTISGSNSINANVVKDSSGNIINYGGSAVYADGGSTLKKRKETTAGPGDNLSFSNQNGKPTWSGAWDY